jgi:hypothetical protein
MLGFFLPAGARAASRLVAANYREWLYSEPPPVTDHFDAVDAAVGCGSLSMLYRVEPAGLLNPLASCGTPSRQHDERRAGAIVFGFHAREWTVAADNLGPLPPLARGWGPPENRLLPADPGLPCPEYPEVSHRGVGSASNLLDAP